MARFNRGNVRYRTRVVYKKVKRAAKGFLGGPMGTMLGAAVYGGVRARISNALSPVTARLPGGEIADELLMFGVSYAGSKMLPKGMRGIGKAGMIIESARIGEFVAERGLSGLMPSGSQTVSNGNTIF